MQFQMQTLFVLCNTTFQFQSHDGNDRLYVNVGYNTGGPTIWKLYGNVDGFPRTSTINTEFVYMFWHTNDADNVGVKFKGSIRRL